LKRHYDSIEVQILKYIADNTTERRLVTTQQIKLGLPHINPASISNSLQRLLDDKLVFFMPKDDRSYGYAATMKGIDVLKEVTDSMLKILLKRN
jgi:RIO-like serine/threonine protein kinase